MRKRLYVIDVLRGKQEPRIQRLGHDQLSTFGLGKHLSQEEWHGIFRQLIHLGYLEQDIANYSILQLTEKAREILRGEKKLTIAKPRFKNILPKKSSKNPAVTNNNCDPVLFERLRQLRKELAEKSAVPPFVIFSDASLVEMVKCLPKTEDEFLAINGVGQKKLHSYGQAFPDTIQKMS
jgi:ATP-dependent DNA helicase RecQ